MTEETMPHFDLPLEVLEQYLPERDEPADFDDFWRATLDEARRHDVGLDRREVDAGYRELITEDIRFAGFDGQPIAGWFVAPRHAEGPSRSSCRTSGTAGAVAWSGRGRSCRAPASRSS
ncbi:hypothetical protein GCM10025881_24480 [Pseudolysinimonas kribbensis]|uniref:Acetyl xylan esterase domain-containing protein n=1 Tax=Pseudolysinimonas kribbensis TaxID=433641 RepID=A0ABQ6K5H8_9MICO|nr:hypothetical protein GCM10025881_24480 [Pseudolysinimonas kribbensis]